MKRLTSTLCGPHISLALATTLLAPVAGEARTNRISVRMHDRLTPPAISVQAEPSSVVMVQRTADFTVWSELLRGHGAIADVPDLTWKDAAQTFYRALIRDKTGQDDWKNVLWAEGDPFRSPESSGGMPESRWIKFALLLDASHRVVFQDSTRYPFHYDFAVARLPAFSGFTRAQFDAATLRTNGQAAVLGAVLFAPYTNIVEVGVQLVGLDPYPRESVATWFETVRAMLGVVPSTPVFYLPTFEQRQIALQHADWFAARGILVSSPARWVISDEVYSPGWALGRLVFVAGHEIGTAYRQGLLRHDDILLTDAVPAEVPPLAGIVSLSPATPNSHVALLARSFGIPFVYVTQPGFAERVFSWAGRTVFVRAIDAFGDRQVVVVPIAQAIAPELRAEIDALKLPVRLDLSPKTGFGQLSTPVDALAPPDIRFVGGKAANFGVLRRSIPTHSPSPALALTFDLWDAYLDQQLLDGRTLRTTVMERLGSFAWPPDMAALQTALREVRDLFTDRSDFSPEQRTDLLAAVQAAGFDPPQKIRFRSSTNVEDSDQFSGAGLYDSFSGCLADDLDGDTQGPSRCDPEEPRERGVFRALRKVYASFYNDNAFLERLRHGVDETKVGMAVLVHHSTPDEFELANGVATLEIRTYANGTWTINSRLVSQAGAVSVTNPDSSVQPEEIAVVDFTSQGPYLSLIRRSSLVPLGDYVMKWEEDYRGLYTLLKSAAQRFQQETTTNELVTLDLEYKKVHPGRLSIKQIRKVPLPVSDPGGPSYLMSTTTRYTVFQGEFGDVVANHRLKSLWGLTTRNLKLVSSNITSTLFASVDAEWREGTNRVHFSGPLSALPDYQFSRQTDHTSDRWTLGTGLDQRQFELRLFDPGWTAHPQGPLFLVDDHRLELSVSYATPQPTLTEADFAITNTTSEVVMLAAVGVATVESKLQEWTLTDKGIAITTRYYWPREPGPTGGGYTAPLLAWAGTTITGLTSRPITLGGDFSQTYRPGHHNFSEDYLFDPWLEPDLDPELLAELSALNIRAIIVRRGLPATPLNNSTEGGDPGLLFHFAFWGLDGQFRPEL